MVRHWRRPINGMVAFPRKVDQSQNLHVATGKADKDDVRFRLMLVIQSIVWQAAKRTLSSLILRSQRTSFGT